MGFVYLMNPDSLEGIVDSGLLRRFLALSRFLPPFLVISCHWMFSLGCICLVENKSFYTVLVRKCVERNGMYVN